MRGALSGTGKRKVIYFGVHFLSAHSVHAPVVSRLVVVSSWVTVRVASMSTLSEARPRDKADPPPADSVTLGGSTVSLNGDPNT